MSSMQGNSSKCMFNLNGVYTTLVVKIYLFPTGSNPSYCEIEEVHWFTS